MELAAEKLESFYWEMDFETKPVLLLLPKSCEPCGTLSEFTTVDPLL